MEILIIGGVRVAGSLPVLRWAFVGGLLAIAVDASDVFLMNLIDLGGLGGYHRFDKYADQAYLFTFLLAALRWAPFPRNVAIALYAFRLVGFVGFEVTGERAFLFLFPNVFELWFLFVASLPHWNPTFVFNRRNAALWLAPLLAVKETQEVILHWGKWLDRFTAVEAIEAIWRWLTPPFGR